MELVITDEKDERFITLSDALDDEYRESDGGKVSEYGSCGQFDEQYFVLLALNYGKAIACAGFRVVDADSIEIRRVYVSKRHRRNRIAYKLIRQLEKIAIDYGYRNSYCITHRKNNEAILLFKKLDYEISDNFENKNHSIFMKKEFKSLIQLLSFLS